MEEMICINCDYWQQVTDEKQLPIINVNGNALGDCGNGASPESRYANETCEKWKTKSVS